MMEPEPGSSRDPEIRVPPGKDYPSRDRARDLDQAGIRRWVASQQIGPGRPGDVAPQGAAVACGGLVEPEDFHAARLVLGRYAVIGGQKERRAIAARIVDQRARAYHCGAPADEVETANGVLLGLIRAGRVNFT